MSGIPRVPRDNDPRRPRTGRDTETSSATPARSYGQSAKPPDRDRDDIEEWEDLTEEPVREGEEPSSGSRAPGNKKKRELREFEDLAGEPVLDENEEDPSS